MHCLRPSMPTTGWLIAWLTLAGSVQAADLLTALPESPSYQLSNLRFETNQFGQQVMNFNFTRNRKGQGRVTIQGNGAKGPLSITASIPDRDSGVMSLRSLFGRTGGDLELYLVVPVKVAAGKTAHMLVSNRIRAGNPAAGESVRAWTAEEQAFYANFKRIMADDNAHKPSKSYPVTVVLPDESQFVPATAKLAKGAKLFACWQDNWHPLTVLSENADGSVNVHWDKFGAEYDCSMTRGELVVANDVLGGLGRHAAGKYPEVKPNIVSSKPIGGDKTPAKTAANTPAGAMTRKSYPVSIAVPDNSMVVPADLKLKAGVPLRACYAGSWRPLTTLGENADGSVNVHWDEFDSIFNCSMVRSELIILKSVVAELGQNPTYTPKPSPLKRKEYPISIALPNGFVRVPENVSVPANTKLQACYAAKWNPITVLTEANDGTLNVHWDEYSSGFDCSMARNELIISAATLSKLQSTGASATAAVDLTKLRTWTDSTGQHKIQATLVRRTADSVTLQTADGRNISLPLNKLSDQDRRLLSSSNGPTENPFDP